MAPPPQSGRSNSFTDSWSLVFIALGVVPVILLVALSWIDFGTPGVVRAPAPMWVNLGTIRGTSADGVSIKTRVVVDAASSSTRTLMERELSQVGLVVQTSLASKTRKQLMGPQGLPGLSDDMLQRLNQFLGQHRTSPAKSVVIQDFLVGEP